MPRLTLVALGLIAAKAQRTRVTLDFGWCGNEWPGYDHVFFVAAEVSS